MLSMYGWRLQAPDCGRSLGYEGENLTRRVEIDTDAAAGPAYFLDIQYSDGSAAALALEWSGGRLGADLTRGYLAVPGTAAVTVRAVDGERVRKSNMELLYVSEAAGEGDGSTPGPGPAPGGMGDHRLLSHRDAEGQHPIGAVDGLTEELKKIPAPTEALTNLELEALLK